MVDIIKPIRRIFSIRSNSDSPPNSYIAKIRKGKIVDVRRGLDKGEMEMQRGKLYLNITGRTKDDAPVSMTLVLVYQPDPHRLMDAAGTLEAFAEKKQAELSHELQATCRYLFRDFTKSELITNREDVANTAYANIEYSVNQLEGLRVIHKFPDFRFTLPRKATQAQSVDELLSGADLTKPVDHIASTREEIIQKLSGEYASWYVGNHPTLCDKIEFWQPIYAIAFSRYFVRAEKNPRLKGKKFEEIVPKAEIESIIEDAYRRQ